MSRAEDLFRRLSAGAEALDRLIADREPESLFLDFKCSPADGAGAQLASDDNKNLSKGISGFGNSAGGVLVWGVDCRRDRTTGTEVASHRPLLDADGFRTKIEGAISRATLAPHSGVQTLSIAASGGRPAGYVAVLVPQWLGGPLRATATHQYHLRAGSDFAIVPHDVLAGMFGRAPQPKVDVNYIGHPARHGSQPGHFTMAFGIVAVNLGAVMGDRPYVTLFYGDFDPNNFVVQCPRKDVTMRRGLLPSVSVIADVGVSIPPGGTEHLCDVVVAVPLDYRRAIVIDAVLGVAGAAPQRFSLRADPEALLTAMDRAQAGPLNTLEILVPNQAG